MTPVDHYRTALLAVRDELARNREILEAAIESGVQDQLLSTAAWERYRSQMDPGLRLRERVVCLFRGHDDYICGSPCCMKRIAWCMRCGRSAAAPLPITGPELAPL
jgi:hypothetical protein